MADVLTDMLDDLRQSIPHQENWDEWLSAVAQVIAAYPTEERQKACVVLVSDDLSRILGLPWWEICQPIQCAVDKQLMYRRG